MKGCLGLLVGVRGAVPIPQLLDRRGEKGQEATGRLGVAWFGLLSIGTYLRARLDRLVSRFANRSGLAHRFGQDLIGGLDPTEGR